MAELSLLGLSMTWSDGGGWESQEERPRAARRGKTRSKVQTAAQTTVTHITTWRRARRMRRPRPKRIISTVVAAETGPGPGWAAFSETSTATHSSGAGAAGPVFGGAIAARAGGKGRLGPPAAVERSSRGPNMRIEHALATRESTKRHETLDRSFRRSITQNGALLKAAPVLQVGWGSEDACPHARWISRARRGLGLCGEPRVACWEESRAPPRRRRG